MKINTLIFVLFVLSSTFVLRSAAIPLNDLLGIAPEDEKYYERLWYSGTIKCKDGSKTFTKSQLNDDFCDCFDGTDEPGTSACPVGKFYCRNAGHRPLTIFSSRVNDGICDCCDGSDEYDGKTRCKNTCWEAGKVARDSLMEKIEIFKEGVSIRNNDVEQAKISLEKDKENLLKLKHEEKILKGIVHQLKDHKDRIEKAVEKERIQKEKDEKQKKESESKEHKGEEKVDVAETEPAKSNEDHEDGIPDNSPGQNFKKDPAVDEAQNVYTSHDIAEQHAAKKEESSDVTHAPKNIDSLSKEDLGREIGSRWTGKKTEHQNHDDDTSVNVHNEENNDDNTEKTGDDHEHYEEDDHMDVQEDTHDDSISSHDDYDPDEYEDISDMESTNSLSLVEKIQETVRNFLLAVNPFQTPVNTSEAESVRKEYDEASEKLTKIKTKISRLTKKLANEFGPEKEFYSLHGRCFETKQNKYVYKVCPFKQATQEEGYSTTRLGTWDKFMDSCSVMLFSNGDNCWNGPDRSLKVRLRCGLEVELSDVDEPSRCEYEAMLTTPALCLKEKLKELEDELKFLDNDQLQLHDEL